jgi:hypothetical protein
VDHVDGQKNHIFENINKFGITMLKLCDGMKTQIQNDQIYAMTNSKNIENM